MCSTSVFTSIMTMVFNFTLMIFFANVADFSFFIWFLLFVFVNGAISFFFKVNYLYCVLSWEFTKLFHATFTSLYIILIFYAIICPYRSHWIPTGNMFTYFCCGWFFKTIFTYIYSFNEIFKIFIHSRSCLIKFLVLIKP